MTAAENQIRLRERTLVRQSVFGCLAPQIGAGGLAPDALAAWLDRLKAPLADLKAARTSGAMPLLSIVDDTADIRDAEDAMATLAEGARTIVFLGTGGSSLGGQTIAQVSGWNIPGGADNSQKGRPRTRFFDNLDAITLERGIASLDLATTRFVITSKSGGTPETLVQAVAVIGALRRAGLESRLPRLVLGLTEPNVTGRTNGLRALCEHFRIPVLDHHTGIGGRYSCLTNVGLLPAIARGLDPRALRQGARAVVDTLCATAHPDAVVPAVGAAVAVGLARVRGIRVNVMMPYADRLARFGNWYVQLWAESLGKGGRGTTPLACVGPLDQHSQLQLFMDGPREHWLTIVRAPAAGTGDCLDKDLAHLAGLPFVAGRPVGDLVAAQTQAVPEALQRAGRPVRLVDIDRLDEAALGALMMSMMIETILAARLFEVDAFDQPAVELAKILTRQRLADQG